MVDLAQLRKDLKDTASRVSLTEDTKKYVISNDFLLEQDQKLQRVSDVIGIIDKPALMNFPMKHSLAYVEENYTPGMEKEAFEELLEDSKKASGEYRDESADYGNRVHAWVQKLSESYLSSDVFTWTHSQCAPDMVPAQEAWLDWLEHPHIESLEFELLATEQPIYWTGEDVAFAGTADCIVWSHAEDCCYILDYKSGGYDDKRWTPYREQALQLAAYALGLQYSIGIETEQIKAMIVKLPSKLFDSKEGRFETKYRILNDLGYHQDILLHTYALRQWGSYTKKWLPKNKHKPVLGGHNVRQSSIGSRR